jgi:hypothetical protein
MPIIQPYLSPIAQTLITAFGVLISSLGLRSMISTRAYREDFGLPIKDKSPSAATTAANPWVQLTGARNVAFGLATVALQYQGDTRAMGTLWLCGLVTSGADGYVTWCYGTRSGAWSHIVGSAFAGVLGGYLVWSS